MIENDRKQTKLGIPLMPELTVILKDSESAYRQKFQICDVFSVSSSDVEIIHCIEEAKKNFKKKPEKILVRISLEIP